MDRNKRNVSLTPAGEYLSNQIKQLDEKVEEIVHGTRLIHAGLKGNLSIGYIGSVMQNIIPELLKPIDRDVPDIKLGLYEMGNTAQVEKLLHHNIDLGFVRMDHLPKPLNTITVHEDTFSVVLPPNHAVQDTKLADLSRMKEEKFILFESSYSQSHYLKVMQIFADAGFTPKIAHHTIHANSIFRLVENGFGVASVPTSLNPNFKTCAA